MHIAFLTPEYPHAKIAHAAGIGTSIKNLVDALLLKNVQVSVFVYGQDFDEVIVEDQLKIHVLKQIKFKFATWYFYRKYLQKYINNTIVTDKIDIVEAADWTGIMAFISLKKPVIIRFHGSDAYFCYLENRKQKLKNYWFEKLGLQTAVAYIAPTNFAGQLTQQIFKIDQAKITTIHYGLDLTKFSNRYPERFTRGLIVYVGTIIRKKGVLELPAILKLVLAQCPNAKLLLIGGDAQDVQTSKKSTWQLLQKNTDSKTLQAIDYLGKLPYDQIQEQICSAHVCVFPTFAETLGMVTIEAMALQKAVVTSHFGWTSELMIDNESGFRIDPEDHRLFANAIINLLKNNSLSQIIGQNAQKRVATIFDINVIVNQNIDFYKQFITAQ